MERKGVFKRILRIAAMLIVPVYIAVFAIFILPAARDKSGGGGEVPAETSVAELWHVDLFEGGSGSRADFLRARALEFEKSNKSKFILIKSMTTGQLVSMLEEGHMPDMFSFGAGLAGTLLPELAAFPGRATVYSNILESGVIEDRVFALPWCTGAYMIAGVEGKADGAADFKSVLTTSAQSGKGGMYSFVTGFSRYNNPLLAAYAASSSLRLNENSLDTSATYTQYEAYVRFVTKQHSTFLLGTQRDAVRLSARENAADFILQPLGGFSDLCCYIAMTSAAGDTKLCTAFMEYLVSEESQSKLTSISMFSVTRGGLYDGGIMQAMERTVSGSFMLNAFTAAEILAEYREAATGALSGNGENIKKLNEVLSN